MQKKHIVFLKSQITKCGGLEKYTLRLMQRFCQDGHKVTLLTTDCPSDKQFAASSFEIVNFGRRMPLSLVHLLCFDAHARKYRDAHQEAIVFGMDRNFCTQHLYRAGNGVHAAYLERRKKQASWIKRCTFCINPLHRLILQMEKQTFESSKLQTLFVNSNMVKEEILSYYNTDPKKISVVHNGVEWHELQIPFDEGLGMRRELTKQLGLDPDRYQFLFVGNEYGRKGLSLVLQALSRMKDRDFQLSVVGKDKNPERYYKMAELLGLKDRVRFFGPIKEVKTLYSVADSLVVASMYDPFANVTIEALAMGLYVISSTANGGSEILSSPERGAMFSDVAQPDELQSRLEEAIKWPKSVARAALIRNSVKAFDFSNQIAKITNALTDTTDAL